jgi:hypothetical protein
VPGSWSRWARRTLPVLGVLATSCNSSTACDCLPVQSHVYLIGTIVNAANVPVSGAWVTVHPTREQGPPPYTDPRNVERMTNSSGEFRGPVHALEQPQSLWLYALVVRPGQTDTGKVQGGQAVFRLEQNQPDTLRMTFQLR